MEEKIVKLEVTFDELISILCALEDSAGIRPTSYDLCWGIKKKLTKQYETQKAASSVEKTS